MTSLPLRDGRHDVGDESAAGRGHVDAEVERDERPPVPLGALHEPGEVDERPREPVQPRGDEDVAIAEPGE
jgi:hypothetical protein